MRISPLPRAGLSLFRPPYLTCESLDPGRLLGEGSPGAAVVWFMKPGPAVDAEAEWLRARPLSLPLFVVLPEPEEILPLAPSLKEVPALEPRGVLPSAGLGVMSALRTLLAAPPPSLPEAVADYLEASGAIVDPAARETVEIIFSSAPHVASIEKLARRMCQSRRTLGRFFKSRDLPVPSHWLQFGRLLHVAVQLQNTTTSIGRVAVRFGYPDGFTMSNSMKRLTGFRPSFVREHLGWEWLLDAWWRREN